MSRRNGERKKKLSTTRREKLLAATPKHNNKENAIPKDTVVETSFRDVSPEIYSAGNRLVDENKMLFDNDRTHAVNGCVNVLRVDRVSSLREGVGGSSQITLDTMYENTQQDINSYDIGYSIEENKNLDNEGGCTPEARDGLHDTQCDDYPHDAIPSQLGCDEHISPDERASSKAETLNGVQEYSKRDVLEVKPSPEYSTNITLSCDILETPYYEENETLSTERNKMLDTEKNEMLDTENNETLSTENNPFLHRSQPSPTKIEVTLNTSNISGMSEIETNKLHSPEKMSPHKSPVVRKHPANASFLEQPEIGSPMLHSVASKRLSDQSFTGDPLKSPMRGCKQTKAALFDDTNELYACESDQTLHGSKDTSGIQDRLDDQNASSNKPHEGHPDRGESDLGKSRIKRPGLSASSRGIRYNPLVNINKLATAPIRECMPENDIRKDGLHTRNGDRRKLNVDRLASNLDEPYGNTNGRESHPISNIDGFSMNMHEQDCDVCEVNGDSNMRKGAVGADVHKFDSVNIRKDVASLDSNEARQNGDKIRKDVTPLDDNNHMPDALKARLDRGEYVLNGNIHIADTDRARPDVKPHGYRLDNGESRIDINALPDSNNKPNDRCHINTTTVANFPVSIKNLSLTKEHVPLANNRIISPSSHILPSTQISAADDNLPSTDNRIISTDNHTISTNHILPKNNHIISTDNHTISTNRILPTDNHITSTDDCRSSPPPNTQDGDLIDMLGSIELNDTFDALQTVLLNDDTLSNASLLNEDPDARNHSIGPAMEDVYLKSIFGMLLKVMEHVKKPTDVSAEAYKLCKAGEVDKAMTLLYCNARDKERLTFDLRDFAEHKWPEVYKELTNDIDGLCSLFSALKSSVSEMRKRLGDIQGELEFSVQESEKLMMASRRHISDLSEKNLYIKKELIAMMEPYCSTKDVDILGTLRSLLEQKDTACRREKERNERLSMELRELKSSMASDTTKQLIKKLQSENLTFSDAINKLSQKNIRLKKACLLYKNEVRKMGEASRAKGDAVEKQRRVIDILQSKLSGDDVGQLGDSMKVHNGESVRQLGDSKSQLGDNMKLSVGDNMKLPIGEIRGRIRELRMKIEGERRVDVRKALTDRLADYERRLADFLSIQE